MSMPLRRSVLFSILLALVLGAAASVGVAAEAKKQARFVGPQVCKECHEEQYESYHKYAKKAHSFKSVAVMAAKLTPQELQECYQCHTTGHGRPGGFVSLAKTPDLKNVSCESCHGPGSLHAESESAEDIKGKLDIQDCLGCHNKERVGAFRFRPLIYGGGH